MRLIAWIREKLFKKKNTVFYIGGSDTLPPPLSAEEERDAILGAVNAGKRTETCL